jgi:hypothetical protein
MPPTTVTTGLVISAFDSRPRKAAHYSANTAQGARKVTSIGSR